MKKQLILGLLGILLQPAACLGAAESPPPDAGHPLTVSSAVDQGLENSPVIQGLQAEVEGAAWKRLEAASGHVPHLSAAANQIVDQKYLYAGERFQGMILEFPSAVPSTTIHLDVSWMIFDGLATVHAYQAADLNYQARRAEWSRARFQVAETVRLRFYQALAALKLLQVASQNIVTLQDHLAIAQVGERSGASTRFNVLRIEALLEEARAEKILAENNVDLARENLFLAMGLPADDRTLTGSLPVPQPGLMTEGLTPVLRERDDLRAQLLRQRAAEQAGQAASGFWWPKLSLYAEDQYYRYKAFDPSVVETQDFKMSYMVGARLTWAIFDGGASLAREQAASKQAQASAQTSRQLLLGAATEFKTWKRKWAYFTSLYQARLRAEEKSQESVRLATLGLKAGTNTSTEVLDAELDLFRSRAGIVRAQMDAAEALINLELSLGKQLPESSEETGME